MKLSAKVGSDTGIVQLKLPGGSTLQWGAGEICCDWQHVFCLSLCCCRYVWENIEVGYVQGMCDLAAPLLVIFDDGKSSYYKLVTELL